MKLQEPVNPNYLEESQGGMDTQRTECVRDNLWSSCYVRVITARTDTWWFN